MCHLGSGAEIALAQLQAARAGTRALGPDDFRAEGRPSLNELRRLYPGS